MNNEQPDNVINVNRIKPDFSVQPPSQQQLNKLDIIRCTSQLKALLKDLPESIDSKYAGDSYHLMIDNHLWVIGELINNMYEIKDNSQQE